MKKRLQNYLKLQEEIKQMDELIQQLNDELSSPKGQIITDMPRGGQGIDESEKICKLADLKKSNEEFKSKLITERAVILRLINEVEDSDERRVLRNRYLFNINFEDMVDKMHYSKRQIGRIHEKALKHLELAHNVL